MITPEILAAIGFILTILLTANAFFIKTLVESLHRVELQTATLIANSEANRDKFASVEGRIKELEEMDEEIRSRMHQMNNSIQVNKTNIEILKMTRGQG